MCITGDVTDTAVEKLWDLLICCDAEAILIMSMNKLNHTLALPFVHKTKYLSVSNYQYIKFGALTFILYLVPNTT